MKTHTPPHDFYERAYAGWKRHCERTGTIFDEPESGGEIEGDTITLRNRNGVLARFRWTGTRIYIVPRQLGEP